MSERIERDRAADRAVGRLRLTGAIVVGLSSIVLAFGGGGSLRWLLVVLGVLASVGWLASYRRLRGSDSDDHLALRAEDLLMHLGAKQRSLPWRAIERVEADEERLVVRVHAGEEGFDVPLVWEG